MHTYTVHNVISHLKAINDEFDTVTNEKDEHDRDQHGSDCDVPLLSFGHPRPLLISLIDRANHQHVEGDHDQNGEQTHDQEVGDEDVVLDVGAVLPKFRRVNAKNGFVVR